MWRRIDKETKKNLKEEKKENDTIGKEGNGGKKKRIVAKK